MHAYLFCTYAYRPNTITYRYNDCTKLDGIGCTYATVEQRTRTALTMNGVSCACCKNSTALTQS